MTDPSAGLRVAVVGAGPAGIYVADALLNRAEHPIEVDLFDRLPTPFGLLRYGVAPDHIKMKSLAKPLARTLDDERVHFVGNVGLGTDLSVTELLSDYHAVVYSFGASVDRRLNIPGEDLPGSHSATSFVNWYSGHPDAVDDVFDLSGPDAVVIGLGNVALDVARVLLRDTDHMATTDIPDFVLDALRGSGVTDVHIVGRRGPEHAKFTHKELRELGELPGVDVALDAAAVAAAGEVDNRGARHNMEIFKDWSTRELGNAPRRLHLHFNATPVAVLGEQRVEGLRVSQSGTDVDLPAQLVFRSVGNIGLGVPGVPLDAKSGTIPTIDHRVVGGSVAVGEYASGWIKRGATGVIGTNRSDASDTAAAILADYDELIGRDVTPGSALRLLEERGVRVVTLEGWGGIDAAEEAAGKARGANRVKLARWSELLAASEKASR